MSRCCYARLASFGIDRVSLCFELKKPTHRYISHTSYQSMTVRMLSFNDALLLIALELWPSHVLLGFFQPARLNAVGGGPNQKRRKENERTTSKSERRPAHRAEEKAAKKLCLSLFMLWQCSLRRRICFFPDGAAHGPCRGHGPMTCLRVKRIAARTRSSGKCTSGWRPAAPTPAAPRSGGSFRS